MFAASSTEPFVESFSQYTAGTGVSVAKANAIKHMTVIVKELASFQLHLKSLYSLSRSGWSATDTKLWYADISRTQSNIQARSTEITLLKTKIAQMT